MKKLIAALIIMAMLPSLSGCSEKEKAPSETNVTTTKTDNIIKPDDRNSVDPAEKTTTEDAKKSPAPPVINNTPVTDIPTYATPQQIGYAENTNNSASCEYNDNEFITPDDKNTVDSTEKAEEETGDLASRLRKKMPITDGSTSAIPLDAAIRASIFGITEEEARAQISHTTSHDSFTNLLCRNCEFVFCHLLSKEQYDEANKMGVEVELTPIAREGFIFLVSSENPIDSLTVEQVKKIYSGEITNWSEVGGEDKKIIAYQRNIDSGSQNYMTAFMGDTPLIDAPVELRPGGMDTLVDAVAAFDGQSYGIGYSVYSYVAGMYNAYDGVKILKIDGVEPSFATIADGTYPCTGYNYAVIRADEKESSPARLLLEYILTDEGQAAIAQTGYFAPLAPTSGIDITIKDLGLMTTTGTGKETCNSELWYNYAKPLTKEMQFGDNIINVPVTNNEKLDAEVTEFVRENAEKFLAENGNKYYFRCDSVLFNGYLSVTLHTQSLHTQSSENFGAVWDIPSGRRLSLSDLFTKGSEFVSYLNIKIDQRIETTPIYEEKVVLKKPFVGLTADFDNFSVGGDYYRFSSDDAGDLFLYFNEGDNDYFGNSFYVQIKVYGMNNCLMKERRDMSSYVNEQKTGWFRHSVGEIKQSVEKVNDECWGYNIHFHTDRLIYSVIDEKYGGAEKINADIRAYIDAHPDLQYYCFSDEGIEKGFEFWKEYLIDIYGIADPTTEDFKKHCLWQSETTLYAVAKEYGEDYVSVHYSILAEQGEVSYGIGIVYDEKTVWYDLRTGEAVDEKDVPLG